VTYLNSVYDSSRAVLFSMFLTLDGKFPVKFGNGDGNRLSPPSPISQLEMQLNNTNGHYEANGSNKSYEISIPWGGFYPKIDSKKPGHANLYRSNGYKSRLAKALYEIRSKSKSPVTISKRRKSKTVTRMLAARKYSRIFKT